ncbi:MAG: hypothetical protein ACR2PR_08160 [Pseudohongiellaceae bacterium]
MKINVPIDISNDDLVLLSNLIDAKVTKRRATRKDIIKLCEQHIAGMLEMANSHDLVVSLEPSPGARQVDADFLKVDPEDQAVLAGKPDRYIIGWNRYKRARAAQLAAGGDS